MSSFAFLTEFLTAEFLAASTQHREQPERKEPFYDKVTRKFGTGSAIPHPIAIYAEGQPEAIFEQKLIELSSKEALALDLGCGDGGFTLRMAPHFRQIVGIDGSVERLKLAHAEQQARRIHNARFEQQNAHQTHFEASMFDLVYSRRGPMPYGECARITARQGSFVAISIGEKDAWDLKQIFGRGQGFRTWKTSALEQATERLQQEGFAILYGQDFFYDEYYASYDDLDLFLQSVPIFEDFDSAKDRALLETYTATVQTNKGFHLARHRFVVVAEKL